MQFTRVIVRSSDSMLDRFLLRIDIEEKDFVNIKRLVAYASANLLLSRGIEASIQQSRLSKCAPQNTDGFKVRLEKTQTLP